MYIFESTVRYSEASSDGRISAGAIVDYFQDCSTFQSESLGVGIEHLRKKKIAWVLSSWQIVIEKYPIVGERIRVGTKAYDFKGLYGYRNFCIMDDKDNMPVKANSLWVFIDTETGMPMRVPEAEAVPYGKEEKLDMKYADRKIKIEGEGEKKEEFPVRKYHIDTNGHMNNAQYIKLAKEYIEEDFEIKMIRAEYKIAAKYGNKIYPVVYSKEDRLTVSLNNEKGKPYAIIEFTK